MDDIKQYWRSLEEFKSMASRKPAEDVPESIGNIPADDLAIDTQADKPSRRDFLKMLGFTVGYAALANSCVTYRKA